ncbi:MAG: endopeptidase La, partial [Clostridia bacterium]|nr:endopeptidase La [Clostridia bacterium]
GRVTAIGGLREKTMAAYLAGVNTIIIPKDNVDDLVDVADEVKTHVTIVPVSNVGEALDVALARESVTADIATDGFVSVNERPRADRGR